MENETNLFMETMGLTTESFFNKKKKEIYSNATPNEYYTILPILKKYFSDYPMLQKCNGKIVSIKEYHNEYEENKVSAVVKFKLIGNIISARSGDNSEEEKFYNELKDYVKKCNEDIKDKGFILESDGDDHYAYISLYSKNKNIDESVDESGITDSMKNERIKILDDIENRIKESGGTINISSDSRKCFLGEQKTGGSPVSGPHSICLAGFGKDNYNKAYNIIKGVLTDYPNYKISKDNYFTMFLSYKEKEVMESVKESDYEENSFVISESDQKSTMDVNFDKKTGGHFEFIDIHSSKADKYLKDNKYFIKNFKKIIDITNGEIVIDVDRDKLAGYIYIGGGNKSTNKNHGFIQTLEVIKEYRGYGLSNRLIDDALKKYNAEDLTVFKDNEVALNLYKKHGFVKIGYGNTKNGSDYWMKHKSKLTKDDQIMESEDYDFEDLESYFKESEESTFIIRDAIFPIVEAVLSTPQGDKKFRKLVENFINKNSSKLHTSGPVYMVPFTDRDKEDFFDCFNTTKNELLKPINDMTKIVNDKANWRLLKQNPIFCLFYECIRYYTLKKDNTGVNTALAIYALSVYPSVFSVIFPHGANPDIMQYTIDNLTAKYIMKQAGNVFSALMMSIQNSYRFLRDGFTNSPDVEVIRFIARIRNDQKSMLKNVANNYYANHKQGLRVKTQSETYGNDQLIDDNVNNTSVVEDVTRKITISLITNGVDMTRASAAAKIAGVSISDLRFYLSKIVVEDRTTELQKFVESILFIFLYQEHHKPNEINEKKFLQFAMDLFRRTNSNDVNVVTIKDSLQKWSDDTGVTTRFKRLASQINYKKGIFMYMILCIQYYNN